MDYKPISPRQPVSLDGIFPNRVPRNNLQKLPSPVIQEDYHPDAPISEPELPALSESSAKSSSPNQPSLLNATIPNPRYQSSKAFGSKPSKRKRWSRKRKILTTFLALLLILIGVGSWYGGQIVNSLDKAFHGNPLSDFQALFSSTRLNGESQGRVNILLAGDSADDPGHGGADLTDSIMVLSINTNNHTAFMMSIPRDLWVYVPGLGSYQKINAANNVTNFNQSGYPRGGMGQLQQIVQTDLGIPIDYYALINYAAFQDAVNAVNGITIDIQSPDPRGIYDSYTHLKLPNGEVTLNGQEALDLARARGDVPAGDITYGIPNSDYTRTMYQREMLVALGAKAKTLGVITNPVKISSLFNAIGNNVQTNLNLQDLLRLVQLTKGITPSSLGSYEYSASLTGATNPLLVGYLDPVSGQDALIPSAGIGNYGQLQQYYLQLTSNNPVVKEGASVVILNGSGVNGLAGKEQGVLKTKGIDEISIADASSVYTGTMIVDQSNGKDPSTKQLLGQLFPGTVVTSTAGSTEAYEAANYPNANFVVILGQNWNT